MSQVSVVIERLKGVGMFGRFFLRKFLSVAGVCIAISSCSRQQTGNVSDPQKFSGSLEDVNQKIREFGGAESGTSVWKFEESIETESLRKALKNETRNLEALKIKIANKGNSSPIGRLQDDSVSELVDIIKFNPNISKENPPQEFQYELNGERHRARLVNSKRTQGFKVVAIGDSPAGKISIEEKNSKQSPLVYVALGGQSEGLGFIYSQSQSKLNPVTAKNFKPQNRWLSVAEYLEDSKIDSNLFFKEKSSDQEEAPGNCGIEASSSGGTIPPATTSQSLLAGGTETRRVVNVILHADRYAKDFFSATQEDYVDHLEGTFLIATTAFENQSQITLRLQALVLDSSYRFGDATSAQALLNSFSSFWNNTPSLWFLRGSRNNITHFVTQRVFPSENIAGLAVLGGICSVQGGIVAGTYSMTNQLDSLHSAMAHEFAHNIGAGHCANNPSSAVPGCYLMHWQNMGSYQLDTATNNVFNSVAGSSQASCLGTEIVPVGSEPLPFRSNFSGMGSLNLNQWRPSDTAVVVPHPLGLGGTLRLNRRSADENSIEPQVISRRVTASSDSFLISGAPRLKFLASAIGESGSIAFNKLAASLLNSNKMFGLMAEINLTNATATQFGLYRFESGTETGPLPAGSEFQTHFQLKSSHPPLTTGSQYLYVNDFIAFERPDRLRSHFSQVGVQDDYGVAVDGLGDVNGDGFDDYIVGAPKWSGTGPNQGRVEIFSGQTGTLLYSISGNSNQAYFGQSVAGVGDWNGDFYNDFVVGAPGISRVTVFSGLTGLEIESLSGPPNSEFGYSVVNPFRSMGRVGTLLVGAPNGMNSNNIATGYMELYRLNQAFSVFKIFGDQAGDRFGHSVAGGERYPSSPYFVGGSCFLNSSRAGYAKVADFNQQSVAGIPVSDNNLGQNFGCSVAVGPGMNPYGALEFMVGNWSRGEVFRYRYTSMDGVLPLGSIHGGSSHLSSIAFLGDIDGDGNGDIALGNKNSRSVKLFCGASTLCQNRFEIPINSPTYGSLGAAVASAGDVNGDGVVDILVGAPSPGTFQNQQGRAEIFTQRQKFFNVGNPRGSGKMSHYSGRAINLSLVGFLGAHKKTFIEASNIQGLQALVLNFGDQIVHRHQHQAFLDLNSVVVPAGSITIPATPQGFVQIPLNLEQEYPGVYAQVLAISSDGKIYSSNILELSISLEQ